MSKYSKSSIKQKPKFWDYQIIKIDGKFNNILIELTIEMFFYYYLLQSKIEKLKNRVRRLQKRGCTDITNILNDKRVKQKIRDIKNLIERLGSLVRAKIISETEKRDIVIYLNEASRGFMWSFVNDFMTECVPRQLPSDEDSDYLDLHTTSNIQEMNDL